MRETYNPGHETQRRFRFRGAEVGQLAIALVSLTVALAFVRAEGGSAADRLVALIEGPRLLVASFIAVLIGFIGHELAHKLVAQHYGHWAEFRLWPIGLGLGLVTAVFARILFALPGAVYILGNVSRRENGLISLVGPGVNLVVAAGTLPFIFTTNPDADVPFVLGTVSLINGLLATFNLIPAGPFDGKKVWLWNRPVWAAAFVLALGLFLVTFLNVVPQDF